MRSDLLPSLTDFNAVVFPVVSPLISARYPCFTMVNLPKEIVIEIPMKKDEPLGVTSNDNMVIVKVQSGTIAEGKLMVRFVSFVFG